MSELDSKLEAILGNPAMMQQIMQLAQAMNQPQNSQETTGNDRKNAPASPIPGGDISFLGKMAEFAMNSGIDNEQRALLKALKPYLSHDRIDRLERAMHAARLAQLASGFLSSGGLQALTGR